MNKCNELINYRKVHLSYNILHIHSFISQKCKDNNGKVILSGTGADEFFTGYYDHHLFSQRNKRQKIFLMMNFKFGKNLLKNNKK